MTTAVSGKKCVTCGHRRARARYAQCWPCFDAQRTWAVCQSCGNICGKGYKICIPCRVKERGLVVCPGCNGVMGPMCRLCRTCWNKEQAAQAPAMELPVAGFAAGSKQLVLSEVGSSRN